MKKAHQIEIRSYPSNIEVFATRDDYDGTWEGHGRILLISCTSDDFPSISYIPTIQEIWDEAEGYLTKKQCKEVKEAIKLVWKSRNSKD